MNFFKSFSLGILYALLSPVILAGCVLVGIAGLFNFIVQAIIMLVNFFKGKKLFPTFEKDVQASALLKQQYEARLGIQKQQAAPQTAYIQQNFYGNNQNGMPQQPFGQIPNQPFQGQLPNTQEVPVVNIEGGEDHE